MHPELVLRRRIDKLMEEVGETGQALGGYTGENPRKGVTHTADDVKSELLDVAVTALGAWEHMDGNRGRAGLALAVKLDDLLDRVKLGAEPGAMMRGGEYAAISAQEDSSA
jgi:NTP pyrophosphatase (non-canonical NTP hydrolase)